MGVRRWIGATGVDRDANSAVRVRGGSLPDTSTTQSRLRLRSFMSDEQTKVKLTRRRWDAYLLPTFVASICIVPFTIWQTGQLRFAASPLGVLSFWVMLRILTPREGAAAPTIRSTPGAVVMLWFFAAAILLSAVLLTVDFYLFDHPFSAPLEAYHALLFAPPVILAFVGVFCAERTAKSSSDGAG